MWATAISFCLGWSQCPTAVGQVVEEAAKESLSKRSFPWYDASRDEVRSVELPQRRAAKSIDRDQVPMGIDKQQPTRPNVGGGSGYGLSMVAWVVVALLIALLFGALLWAFFRIESRSRTQRDVMLSQRSLAESIKQLPFQMKHETGDLRQLAQQAYAASDFRQAIIYLFSHVLITLDQNGLIRLRKGKTNRQYLRELRPYRSLSDFYQQIMVPFEATFFGDHIVSQADFESCWNQLDGFQNRVNQTSQVVP